MPMSASTRVRLPVWVGFSRSDERIRSATSGPSRTSLTGQEPTQVCLPQSRRSSRFSRLLRLGKGCRGEKFTWFRNAAELVDPQGSQGSAVGLREIIGDYDRLVERLCHVLHSTDQIDCRPNHGKVKTIDRADISVNY